MTCLRIYDDMMLQYPKPYSFLYLTLEEDRTILIKSMFGCLKKVSVNRERGERVRKERS